MPQEDAQAKFYQRPSGKEPAPTLEDVSGDEVPTLAAASADLATQKCWKLGPLPVGELVAAAMIIIAGSFFIAAAAFLIHAIECSLEPTW